MDRNDFIEIMANAEVDDIRHIKIEWQDENYIKVMEYHQINKEGK